jgi:hypothetical protein
MGFRYDTDAFERGLKKRRQVMGNAFVDRAYQQLIR